jgi:hypothetical protein
MKKRIALISGLTAFSGTFLKITGFWEKLIVPEKIPGKPGMRRTERLPT